MQVIKKCVKVVEVGTLVKTYYVYCPQFKHSWSDMF